MKAIKHPKAPLSSLEHTNGILTTFGIFIRMNITLRDIIREILLFIRVQDYGYTSESNELRKHLL